MVILTGRLSYVLRDHNATLLDHIFLTLSVGKSVPLVLASLADRVVHGRVVVVHPHRVHLIRLAGPGTSWCTGLGRGVSAVEEGQEPHQQRTQRGQGACDDANARLDHGPEGDTSNAEQVVVWRVII